MKTITFHTDKSLNEIIEEIVSYQKVKTEVIFNLEGIVNSSSALIAIIDNFQDDKNFRFILNPKLNSDLEDFQKLIAFNERDKETNSSELGLIKTISDFFSKVFNFMILSSDCFYFALLGIVNPKGRRKGAIYEQTYLMGYKAVPIIVLLSILIGLILSIQSAQQLRQFGANIFLVDLIVVSMISEMGPMITAIIVAGRSGSAISAEIATMKITEELDALKVMALDPLKYVVTPKFIAMTISLPILTIIANLVGILGGFIIAVLYLDLNPDIFISRAIEMMSLYMWFQSFLKSILFSWVIVLIGVYFGLNVSGGSEGVGKGTTASVVASIFSVIVLDALLSLIFYFKF